MGQKPSTTDRAKVTSRGLLLNRALQRFSAAALRWRKGDAPFSHPLPGTYSKPFGPPKNPDFPARSVARSPKSAEPNYSTNQKPLKTQRNRQDFFGASASKLRPFTPKSPKNSPRTCACPGAPQRPPPPPGLGAAAAPRPRAASESADAARGGGGVAHRKELMATLIWPWLKLKS